jgi:hypothetical protein
LYMGPYANPNRFDLPIVLFDRQRCIIHLYNSLPDQSRVRTNARVERIDHTNTGVKVFLADGTVEEADMGTYFRRTSTHLPSRA